MPKVKIDYSNTIFYKIFCKDTSVKELYIGHTTNFVQRKYAHKQSCINTKSVNYNCKVYKVIRDNMGWDNWTMEIIAFHNCEDLHSAKKQEQQYFEEYNATLNSIEPLPPRKPKKEVVIKPPKEVFYCSSCRVYFNTRKSQEEHNKRPRHIKLSGTHMNIIHTTSLNAYICEKCNYKTDNKKDYNKHLLTGKHKKVTSDNDMIIQIPTMLTCLCGNGYKHRSGLSRHKKKCTFENTSQNEIIPNTHNNTATTIDTQTLLIEIVKQNNEFKDLILEERREFQQIIKDLIGNNKTSNSNSN